MAVINFPELVLDLAAFGVNLGALPSSKTAGFIHYHIDVVIFEKSKSI